MARGVNKVTLIGNLGDDPETKWTRNDTCVVTLRLATTAVWKDRDGNKQENTEWHRVTAFGKQAEVIDEYSRKGDQLYIEGRLHYDKYDDKEGITRYTTDIILEEFQFLNSKRDGEGSRGSSSSSRSSRRDDRDDDRRESRSSRSERPARQERPKQEDPLPGEDPGNETTRPEDFADDDIPF